MNTLRLNLIRWPVLIGVVFSLTAGAMPASAGQPSFCKGKRVPEQYFGRVAFVPKSASVVRGGYLYARLFNGLGRPVGSGHRYWEQRYVDGTWTTMPPTPPPEGALPTYPPASMRRHGARSAGPCIRFKVDAERPPGKYRLVTEVFTDLQPGAKSRFRTAEFRIR
jgi:hypothetical protein